MAIATRIEAARDHHASTIQCSDCGEDFIYAGGFPEYCPECGEMFHDTEDNTV